MCNSTNNTQLTLVAPTSKVANTSQVADRSGPGDTRVVNIEINNGDLNWSVAE